MSISRFSIAQVIALSLVYNTCKCQNDSSNTFTDLLVYKDSVIACYEGDIIDYSRNYVSRISLFNGKELALFFVTTYRDGKENGDNIEFYPTNIMKQKQHYKSGKLDGYSYFWSKDGQLNKLELWKNGKLLSRKKYPKVLP
ncbi:MAG: hypothetical protein LH619_14265 [Chitinophagaceae bacterium]|nr:hypothetical protein [Chitinophagaceae bacterium]